MESRSKGMQLLRSWEREIARRKLEAKAETLSSKTGKPVKVRLRPDDTLDPLEKLVFVLKIPN